MKDRPDDSAAHASPAAGPNPTDAEPRDTPGVASHAGALGSSFIALALLWTALIAGLAVWETGNLHDVAISLARTEAISSLNKDLVYRRWATGHGGVYVPVTESTPPNPYLTQVPERDITTPSGRKLTLMNPAYMTRQVLELGKRQYGAQGHITSLRPLRPQNAPDAWEAASLRAFEAGEKERVSVEVIGAESYLRFMRPMIVEPGCMKCHAAQGYAVGDIRGGLSVSVPFQPYHEAALVRTRNLMWRYAGLWIFGLGGLWFARRRTWRAVPRRTQAEAALREAKEFSENLIQTANVFFVELNIRGEVVRINPEAERITGYSLTEVAGKNWFELLTPRARYPNVWAEFARITERGEVPKLFENPILTKDGVERHIVWQNSVLRRDGAIAGTISFGADITERTQVERALQESEGRYRSMFELAIHGIFQSTAAGRAIAANPAFVRMLGYASEEDVLKTLTDLPHGLWAHADERAKVARLIGEHGFVRGYECEFLRKDGAKIWVSFNAAPVHEPDGTGSYFQASIDDISERKLAEQAKENLEAQLQQAQKMESVGRLAGGVAHDFNNMLGVILGNVELALQRVDSAQPIHADLMEIHSAAKRSADLTRQLLAYARKQTVAPEVLDLNATVPGLLTMLRRLLGENIQMVWEPATTLWPVTVDPSQLAGVLTNLCLNARDAIAGVGTITLSTANCALDAEFCRTYPDAAPGDYVRLAVRDTGSGMDAATLLHVFEPFYTTKGVGEGTGLGLASVYGAIKQNRGVVTVSSAPGCGTTFHLYLPRQAAQLHAVRQSMPVAVAPAGQETILLVEDEPAILRLTTRVLEGRGYAVLAAGSPSDAMRLAQEYGDEIQLLLSDVVMPGMSGRDLARSLATGRPSIRLLFMSGHPADVIASRGMLDDGVSFLEKPYSIAALLAKVREVLDRE